MDLELKDKVLLLTGATGGIGRQICADFLNEGAIVVGVYRNEIRFEELKKELADKKINCERLIGMKTNILNNSEIQLCVDETLKRFQRIDILINCAGNSNEIPFAWMTEKQIDEMIDINFKSPMLFSQAVLKPMFSQKEGCIINISTIGTQKKGRGIVVYAAAKAGLEVFTRTLAHEVGRKNIRVNCIRPGVIKTDMSAPLLDRTGNLVVDSTALHRLGKPEDISAAALFLASTKTASFITASQLDVDGGIY
jgi:3-oxoacyl-[acyl-carrier protein] reductase